MRTSLGIILLVDDEEPVRDPLSLHLTNIGHTVHQATGDSALRMIEVCEEMIDILITDVVMPRVNGVALAHAARGKYPGIPIIFVSGYDEQIMDRYPGAPDALFLKKPFLPSELARVVTTLLTLRVTRDSRKPIDKLGD